VKALNCPRVQESQNFRNQEPKVLLADEREAAVATPPTAEVVEVEPPVVSIAPEVENAPAAERVAPRLVKKNHGPLTLHIGMLDPEVERVLVDGALKLLLLRLRDRLL